MSLWYSTWVSTTIHPKYQTSPKNNFQGTNTPAYLPVTSNEKKSFVILTQGDGNSAATVSKTWPGRLERLPGGKV